MNKPLLLGAAWTASAAAAVGLGFLAVSLVDASASSPSVEAAPSSTAGSGSAPSSTAAAVAPSGEQATAGGTVFASCAGGSAVPVLSGAPASGWWPDARQEPGTFEFTSPTQSIEVRAACVGGAPRFTVEGPTANAASSSPAAPSSSGIEPGDDHGGGSGSGSGRHGDGGGGGHGSDG